MELRATQWLVDKSDLSRADPDEVADRLEAFIQSGPARVSIPDLLIADVTGQPMEWIVARGSIT